MKSASFINKSNVAIHKSGENQVKIMKATKEGTNRTFFYPETIDGKRINATMFARLYDAVRLGKIYIAHLEANCPA